MSETVDHRGALRLMLAEVAFPAPTWRLVAQAQSWGAAEQCVTQLLALGPRCYDSAEEVLSSLGQPRPIPPARRRGRRARRGWHAQDHTDRPESARSEAAPT